jgi:hypothetical protein
VVGSGAEATQKVHCWDKVTTGGHPIYVSKVSTSFATKTITCLPRQKYIGTSILVAAESGVVMHRALYLQKGTRPRPDYSVP